MDPGTVLACSLSFLIGAGFGTFSGLVPGIHVNALASFMLAFYPSVAGFFGEISGPENAGTAVCCCIMSASVVHSFLDFVPSVFIGAPDSEDSVSVLPGHRLLLAGRGMEAVRAAAAGSLVGTSCAIALAVPFQILMHSGGREIMESATPFAVAAVSAILITAQFRRGSGPAGIAAFLISGAVGLGVMFLPIPSYGIAGEGSLMFPMLTGLFGVPVLLGMSSAGKIPEQEDCGNPEVARSGLRGVIMGCAAGWFPGITATAGASVSACFMPENKPEKFIAAVASIGSVTAVLSLVTLSVSGGGRSGTALAIGKIAGDSLSGIASETFMIILRAAAAASLSGYILTIGSGKLFARIAGSADSRSLSRKVFAADVILVLVLTGPFGLIVLAVSSLAGFIPDYFGTDRTILCGCLLVPVILMNLRAWTPPSP